MKTLQQRVHNWMLGCFGLEVSSDTVERNDRFVEEALELAQATGWTSDRAHALVDYVFGRPAGDPAQEVGGVMVTLAALCNVHCLDIEDAAICEVERITQPDMMLKIRAKQASKPTGSALPGRYPGEVAVPAPVPMWDDYDRGRRDMLNAILALNPTVSAKVAKLHGREPDPEGRLPFDVVLWVTEVASQLDIEPRDEALTASSGEAGR